MMQINLNIPENASAEYVLHALAGAMASAAASTTSASKATAAEFVPVYVNGHQFTTQSELDDYLARAQARDANLAEWGAAFAAKGEVLEPGQLDCRTFNIEDAYFFWRFGAELTAYVGPRAPENRLINTLDAGSFPDPEFPHIQSVDQAQLRGGWDWTNYRGPLRAFLAKHRGVADI